MDLGALLRQTRERAGLTQHAVAAAVGVTPFALSRWETGARPVRADLADRVLAACDADVRFTLVPRQADLDAALSALAGLTVQERVRTLRELLSVERLDELQATGAVIFCGAWAALAHGLPPLQPTGGLLVTADPVGQARASAVLRQMQPLRIASGGPWSVTWDDAVFERNPAMTLYTLMLGTFTSQVVTAPTPELRLETDAGPWRVVLPESLVPDVVDAETVGRWRERAT